MILSYGFPITLSLSKRDNQKVGFFDCIERILTIKTDTI